MFWLLLLPFLVQISDAGHGNPEAAYNHALREFLHGRLETSQWEAAQGSRRFAADVNWAARFQLLEAESMVWRGTYDIALPKLESLNFRDQPDEIEQLSLEGISFSRLHQLSEADAKLLEAERICSIHMLEPCGSIFRARGIFFLERGKTIEAQQSFLTSLAFARAHNDQQLQGTALLNLGFISLQNEHFDEAVDWITAAYRTGLETGDENRVQGALGNLAWAYFRLGDLDKAEELFLDAEARAARLGNLRQEIEWITAGANVYQTNRDWTRATEAYKRALELSRQINERDDIVNALEDLAHTSIDAGNLNEAQDCIRQLEPLIGENRLDDLDVEFAKARVASSQHRWKDAEQLFQAVDQDPVSQSSMRMGSEHELARVYESSGDTAGADRMYRTALSTYDSARDRLKREDSKLPFLTNAARIYRDFVRFLIAQHKFGEALQIADQSRAQTLAQGLGVTSISTRSVRPNEIARRSNATLLFYWLGEQESYLWVITPAKTNFYILPTEGEIAPRLKRYRSALLGLGDPAEDSNQDGIALYRMLVEPAASLISKDANLVVLCDGELSQLNFETLIVPAPHPHYLIEDATITSAPSLQLLASASSPAADSHKLLLLGDAVSPNPDYPDLPMAATEMQHIQQHFGGGNRSVFAREHATPDAYLAANPQRFAYIHFVAHGVASRTDPLDSAIVLSRSTAAEDSFKLHARDIIQHPIHARLVTISSCYGSGARSYAGEGSVGLAWAFLRAGAHNVIGALWEVSDQSTPQLMGDLYQQLDRGLPPSTALRQAKLSLLHSQMEFRKPFYWAPLQIYTGL